MMLLVGGPAVRAAGVDGEGLPSIAAQIGEIRLAIVPGGSEARFRAHEQLAGFPLPTDPVGSTRAVSGEIFLLPDGAIDGASRIVVDLRTLKSDDSDRDDYIQTNTLETAKYPTAEFAPAGAPGLPVPLPSDGSGAFQLVGPLTVHGVTRTVTWDATATFNETEVSGSASTRVRMTDFGMTPPQVWPVLSIQDELTLEIDLRASVSRP
jgi:polyisoprenoid-binding protein YceI